MILDFHCHTMEGSPDSCVTLMGTVKRLKEKGYNGMVVTDHNSYNGYKSFEKYKSQIEDFKVFRGVEYDTRDAGHMLIVLPTGMDYEIFTLRGMFLKDTIKVVHALGGIIGAAHPFDYYRFGACNHPNWLLKMEQFKELDFIETFNACGGAIGNALALQLAEFLNKPCVAGSDSHRPSSVGLAQTLFSNDIETENDLIKKIKESDFSSILITGELFSDTLANKHKIIFNVGIRAYSLLNNYIGYLNRAKTNLFLQGFDNF